MKKNKLETKIKKIISKKDKKNDEYNFLLKKIKKMENRLEVLEDKLLKDVESNSKNDEEFYKNDNEVKESVNLDKKNDENIKLEIVEEKNDEVKYDEFNKIDSIPNEEEKNDNESIKIGNDVVFTLEEVDIYKKCMYDNLLEDNISIGVAKISKLTQISLTKARAIKKYLQEQKVIDTIGKTKTKVIKF